MDIIQFLANYGLFFLKTITLALAIILSFAAILTLSSGRSKTKAKLTIKKLNDYYEEVSDLLSREILDKKALKNKLKEDKRHAKEKRKLQKNQVEPYRRKIFVINFDGDIKASAVKNLREEITAILTIATPKDEVLIKINSVGGIVHGYGLAAAQLQRVRAKHIPLTVSIDKVAASGGYMMACVGNTILAAPFAIIGSIGVVMQLPNFHRYLDKHNVDVELLTAGKYKRTLTLFGKNTAQDRQKAQTEIEDIHLLFQDFIKQNRPDIDMEQVATGEYWHASRAIEKRLVDRLITSDDYLFAASHMADIYEVSYQTKKAWVEKFSTSLQAAIDKVMDICMEQDKESRFF